MRKMKDSGIAWIGAMPDSWIIETLKHALNLCDEKVPFNGETYIGLENVESFTGKYLHTEAVSDGICNKFNAGNILFGKLRPYLAKCYVAEFDGVCSTEFLVLSALNGNNDYFRYLLLSPSLIEIINASTFGAKMPRANWSFIGSLKVALPNDDEQRRITHYLDAKCSEIEAIAADIRATIEKFNEYKQTVITRAVTKGLDPTAPMKDSGVPWIGEIPQTWFSRRLKKISPAICVGIVINPSQYISDEGLPYIYGGDIKEFLIDWQHSRKISPSDSLLNSKTKLDEGDILTIRVGYPGISSVVPKECSGGNCASVMLIRRGNFNSQWLCYCMNSNIIKFQISVVKYGAAQEQFNISHAVEFVVPYPPLEDQDNIVNYLDAKCAEIDEAIAQQEARLAMLEAYKKSLIYECVTGKREVPTP